jgi:hypothetical protein
VAPNIGKVDGVSSRGTWSAEIVDKAAFIRWCLDNPAMLFLIVPDMTALNQRARNEHDALSIPGVKAVRKIGYGVK